MSNAVFFSSMNEEIKGSTKVKREVVKDCYPGYMVVMECSDSPEEGSFKSDASTDLFSLLVQIFFLLGLWLCFLTHIFFYHLRFFFFQLQSSLFQLQFFCLRLRYLLLGKRFYFLRRRFLSLKLRFFFFRLRFFSFRLRRRFFFLG